MTRQVLREAPWTGQVATFVIDSMVAFGGTLGAFTLAFGRSPNILSAYDFTIIIALNAILFSLPALVMGGATIGAKLMRYRMTHSAKAPSGWISLVRGLYFFPFGMIITGFHLPLKLMLGDHAPFDPMFGLRLKSTQPARTRTVTSDTLFDGLMEAETKTQRDELMFGTQADDIADARCELERALGIKFTERDSSFWGSYFACDAYGGKMMLLPNNRALTADAKTDPPLFAGTDDFKAIFHVTCAGSRLKLVEDLVLGTSFTRVGK